MIVLRKKINQISNIIKSSTKSLPTQTNHCVFFMPKTNTLIKISPVYIPCNVHICTSGLD